MRAPGDPPPRGRIAHVRLGARNPSNYMRSPPAGQTEHRAMYAVFSVC